MTNEQGVVIARHDFMPFGEEVSPQSPPKDRKLFTGQERDFETGLDYFNARQYRPDLGQFTAPDPLSLVPEPVGSQALGSYTYVSNSPLTSIDPTGMFGIDFGGFSSGFGGISFWLSYSSAMYFAGGGLFGGGSGFQAWGVNFAPTFSTGGAATSEFGAMWTGAAIASQAANPQSGLGSQPASTSAAGGSTRVWGVELLDAMKEYDGKKYTWGGTTPEGGFDCRGLFYRGMRDIGLSYNLARANRDVLNLNPGMFTELPANASHKKGDIMLWVGHHIGVYDPDAPVRGLTVYSATSHGVRYGDPAWWAGYSNSLIWLRISRGK